MLHAVRWRTLVLLGSVLLWTAPDLSAQSFADWKEQLESGATKEKRLEALRRVAGWKASEGDGPSDTAIARALGGALDDPEAAVRQLAARFLGEARDQDNAQNALERGLRNARASVRSHDTELAKLHEGFFKALVRAKPEAAALETGAVARVGYIQERLNEHSWWAEDLDPLADEIVALEEHCRVELDCIVALCTGLRGIGTNAALGEVRDTYEFLEKAHRDQWADLAPILLDFGTRAAVRDVVQSLAHFEKDRKFTRDWENALIKLENTEKNVVSRIFEDPDEAWGLRIYASLREFTARHELTALADPVDRRISQDARTWFRKVQGDLPTKMD